MRNLGFCFALCLLSAAPAFAQKVTTDFDRQFDFSGITKLGWAEGGTPAPSELTEKRIRAAIEEELKKKGMLFVAEGEQPDLHIITHAAVDKQAKGSSMRVGIGVGRSTGRGGVSVGGSTGGGTKVVEVGTLLIEIFDPESSSLVWRATASDTLKGTAEKNEQLLNKAVQKAFKDFPPQEKKK
jgi:hypothetical protein